MDDRDETAMSEWGDPKPADMGEVSDGYHTFSELYAHRIALFIALCGMIDDGHGNVWRSKAHSDGSIWLGWFILGINTKMGEQITYHLPISDWERTDFARTVDKAPEYDGHTSADVLSRLKKSFG